MTLWKVPFHRNCNISPNVEIAYDTEFGRGDITFGYFHCWGYSLPELKSIALNAGAKFSIKLIPQGFSAQINAIRCHGKVKMEYESYLTGAVVMNYYLSHNGYHFRYHDVDTLLKQSNEPNSYFFITKIIEFNMYSKLRIIQKFILPRSFINIWLPLNPIEKNIIMRLAKNW